jgi:DNA-binding CsgD family transcriptional regulator
MLVGREPEQRLVDELLDSARGDRSAVLVLRGEPGIGKSALLDYAEQRATGMTILRCVGIEAEHELPFAGLHQLLRPCLELLEALPAPQAAALRGAFGLSFDRVDSPFLVSLGLLGVLAEACESAPVLCLIDDAHWLDGPSQDAIAFAARRLEAEPIAILAASRSLERYDFRAAALPAHELQGLEERHARLLLESGLDRPAAPKVVQMLVQASHGNPLALLELPAGLSSRQLEGAEPIVGPVPTRSAVEESFRARMEELPDTVRRALLVAAAEEEGDLDTVERALDRCGLPVSVLQTAADAGLVRTNGAIVFRHPLVRSAIYGSATRAQRRVAHEALAAALDDPVRRAWHRALVAERGNEAIAAELDAAGQQALARGAPTSGAVAFERAAELSEDRASRGHRLLLAAQSSLRAGGAEAAMALADRAAPLVLAPADVVELDVLRAIVSFRKGAPAEPSALVTAAAVLAEHQPQRALELVAHTVIVAERGGWAVTGIPDARRLIDRIPDGGLPREFMVALLDGLTALIDGDAELGGNCLDEALAIEARIGPEPLVAVMSGLIGFWTARYALARDRFARIVAQNRADGSLTDLVGTLFGLAAGELCTGHLQAGLDAAHEGLELARQVGYENEEISFMALLAWITALLGREQESRELADVANRRGMVIGVGYASSEAQLALGELELGLGNAEAAIEHFEQIDPGPFPPLSVMASPELIDAALRLGDLERAHLALERFAAWAPVSRTPLVDGMLARCRAMLAQDPDQAARLFEEALHHHDHRVQSYERARTQLAYGEHLRRERRRIEARIQLRRALDTFEGGGVVLWAERARSELQATGETARKRDASTLDELTPQELRVARLVAAGASNRDVAAQLFLSRRTIEYHLGKVFVKLGVSSRTELARLPFEPGSHPFEPVPAHSA